MLADHARRRELVGALVVGARQDGLRFDLADAAAGGSQLIGQIAGPDQGHDLSLLDAVAALDEDGVDVAQDLRPDVGLLERTQIHRRLDLDGNVAGHDFGHDDRWCEATFCRRPRRRTRAGRGRADQEKRQRKKARSGDRAGSTVQIQHSAQGLVPKVSARNSSFRKIDAKNAGSDSAPTMRYAEKVKWQIAICAASVAAACRNPATVAVGVASVPQTKSNILRSDYVGSAACRPCHADVFAKWMTSPMHKMTRDPAEAEIRAPFAGETFAFKKDRVTLFSAGDGRFMRL